MSKKKLLEEAQIRRMFQLAGLPAIGEGFIGGKYAELAEEDKEEEEKEDIEEGGMKYSREEEEEEPVEEGGMKYSREEEEEGGEEPADELGEEPEADMGAEPAAMGGGDIPQDKVEAIVDAVLAGIEKETGVPLERVPEAGAEEASAEEAPAEEPEMAMGGEEEEGEPELAMEYSEKVIEEVSRRVARKLIQLTKKNK